MSHWNIKNNHIIAETSGNPSPIAEIIIPHAVKQLLAYAKLGEDVEAIIDQWYAGDRITDTEGINKIFALMKASIELTR